MVVSLVVQLDNCNPRLDDLDLILVVEYDNSLAILHTALLDPKLDGFDLFLVVERAGSLAPR